MNEGLKTLIYAACGILAVVVAYASRPNPVDVAREPEILKPLFPEFDDPREATRLEIVKVDSDLGQLQRFEVARDKKSDRWTIPSHSGYPADAEDQMRDVSLMFIDLKPIGLHSTVAEDHAMCGVVEPNDDTASRTAQGVGTLVVIEDRDGDELAQLVIGKPVKGRENQYFVRVPGKDPVYVVSVTPEKLSTKFEDWIEKDLLQLNAWDIEELQLHDYSVVERLEPGTYSITERMKVALKWDGSKSEWNLDELLTYPAGKATPTSLAEGEQLNTEKLNELKTALDDLEIIDVFRKPEGMRADLRADKSFLENRDSFRSLVEKGFYPLRTQDGAEIKSANGEIRVGMKDGVDYVLRFGDPVTGSTGSLNRFLFVMAEFDESQFPMPEKPAGLDSSATPAESGDAGSEDRAADPAADSDAASDDPATSDETTDADAGAAQSGGCQEEAPQDQNAAVDAAEQDAVEQDAVEQDAAEQDAAGDAEAANDAESAAQPEDAANEGAESEQQMLEKEYQRKLDEREENIKKGKKRAAELNARFADWYYVISEDIYKKVHLGRADIIKSAGADEDAGVGAFRELEEQGLSTN